MCVSLIAGATFALFTSESKVNIAVTSGTVNVMATIDQSSVYTKQLGDADYTQGADHIFEGEAAFDKNGLTLTKFMPGDGIKFNIVVENNSDVTIKYRTIIICENDTGLFSGLEMKIGSDEKYNGLSYVADWATLDVGAGNAEIPVVVELPEGAGNEYQGKTCTVSYKVEAVQGNATTEDPADDTIYIYTSNDLKALSGYVAKTETTIELCADVDMTGKAMQAIQVGTKSALTFNGNGHTISNIKIGAAGANGMTGAGNEVAGLFDVSENSGSTLTVNNLTVKNADVACAGYAAVIVGYANSANDVITLKNVDVIGATVVSDSVAALVGYTVGPLTMTDCDVSGLALTGEAGRPEKVGAFVGTANTASCVVMLTNCTNNTEFAYAGRVINGATMTLDGWNLANSANELQSLLDAKFTKIKFGANIVGNVTIKQAESVNVEIDGNGYKFNGIFKIDGAARYSGAETLKIMNVNFVAKEGAESCIYSPDKKENITYSYSHNVTIYNCTFTDIDGKVNCAAIRHGDGGDVNWTVEKCTVDSTMHSLLQVNNVNKILTVKNCTINSKNGINLNSCTNVVLEGNVFDTLGYCVRFGVDTGGEPDKAKTFAFTNNTLTSQCDDGDAIIIFRVSANNKNTTVTMTGNTLTGNKWYNDNKVVDNLPTTNA